MLQKINVFTQKITLMRFLAALISAFLASTSQLAAQFPDDFEFLLEDAKRDLEFEQLSFTELSDAVHLVEQYIHVAVLRQSNISDPQEIQESLRVLGVMRDVQRSAMFGRPLHLPPELDFGISQIGFFELDEVASSFNQRRSGFENVLNHMAFLQETDPSELEGPLLRALAIYAVISLAVADVDQFRRGEFCVMPFWPLC